jgi:hypothetical protein
VLQDVLSRSREQLGFFWRSLAPIPLANLLLSVKLLQSDISLYLQCAVVIAFLARYSIGNYNYVVAIFGSSPKWLPPGAQRSEVRRRFAFDAVLFGLQLSALIWMGLAVQSPTWFRRGLIDLLLADMLFLLFDRYSWPECVLLMTARRRAKERCSLCGSICLQRDWPAHYSPRLWVMNNFFTALALIIFDLWIQRVGNVAGKIQAAVVVVACLINSIVDIYFTGLDVSEPEP